MEVGGGALKEKESFPRNDFAPNHPCSILIDMSVNSNIGNKLKRARMEQGLTQEELAERAGIRANYYAKIERGEINTTIDTLQKIASALNVKSSDILPF